MWLASIVPRRIIRAATLFALLVALSVGGSIASAWRSVSSMTLRTGYRIRQRLALAEPALRTTLLSRAPPPASDSLSPTTQLLAHLRAALGPIDSFAAYQLAFQRSVFG